MVAATWWPLTRAQQGVWFAHALDPANPCMTTAEVVRFRGRVDAERLARAHARAYAEFEATRMVFASNAPGPVQRLDDSTTPRLEIVDVGDQDEATTWIEACLARPMDLTVGDTVRAALLRWSDAEGAHAWWLHAAHHVVLDGYGAQQCLRRIAELHADPVRETERRPGIEALLAEDDELADEAVAGWEAEWEAELATFTGTASLAGRTARAAARPLRRTVQVDAATQDAVKRGARRLGVSWPDLLTGVVGSYLARLAGQEFMRIGIPLMNRTVGGRAALASSRTVCTAVNVLPLPVPGVGSVGDLLADVTAGQDRLRRHPFARHEALTRRLQQRAPGAQLFGAQVNVVPFDQTIDLGEGLVGQVHNLTAGPVDDMTVTFRGAPGRGRSFTLEWDANPRLHDVDELEWHLHRLLGWLGVLADAPPEALLEDLPLLTEVERHCVLERFNASEHPHDAATLGERFLAQARRTPDATAVIAPDGTRSYAELLAAARRIAAGLHAEGIGAGDVVGVALDRSVTLLEVVHGVALLGAVHLPVDRDLPPARVEGMLADAGAVRVVHHDDVPDADPTGVLTPPGIDDPAYLLFTSGSTGRPKGVVVSHRAIDNRLAWQQHHLPLRVGDRVMHKTPISFDVSIWELFWALQQGATLVVAAPGEHRDPRALAETLVAHEVAVIHFVPSMLRAFVHDPVAVKAASAAHVRHVVTSGEALTPDLVSACLEVFGVSPTNLYGPTEAAVDVTVWDCAVGDDPVPIGRPVWNTRCYVLDEQRRPAPIGVPGELWLAGAQLALGYHGRADLTAERFVPDPYVPAPARMYRTGDLASWRPDGALVYLGRTDDQVKVRGQRLELGEVENALAGTPGVTGVCAGTADDGARLVVWFTCDGDEGEAEHALRERAAALLPPAWLPHDWVTVPAMPLGTSGKTDRGRLATEHPPLVRRSDDQRGPRDVTEQRWCEVMADVLGLPVVQPEEDFFALGGDSLRVLALLAAAHRELGCDLRLGDVFAAPTPAALARLAPTEAQATTGQVLTLRVARAEEPRAHLVLLPPAGGLGWCYTAWLRDLPDDVSIHTVQAPGLEKGRPEPVADLDALAARQWASIKDVVGDRPVHVAGWSLGGMAAHALAVHAQALGRPVASVTVVDAYPSDQWRHLPEPTERDGLLGLLRLGGVDTADLVEGETRGEHLDRGEVVRMLRESGSAVGSLPEETLAGCVASVLEAARLVRSSSHGVLDADLTVVVATAPRPETWLDADGWQSYVTGTVTRVAVEARHEQLVRRPYAQQVAEVLAGRLA